MPLKMVKVKALVETRYNGEAKTAGEEFYIEETIVPDWTRLGLASVVKGAQEMIANSAVVAGTEARAELVPVPVAPAVMAAEEPPTKTIVPKKPLAKEDAK